MANRKVKEIYTPIPLGFALKQPHLIKLYHCNEEQFKNPGTKCHDRCDKVWDVTECRKIRITFEECDES